jgi:hypothetical protein
MTELDLRGSPAPIIQARMGAIARYELPLPAAVPEAGRLGAIGGARGRIADDLAAHATTSRGQIMGTL